MLERRVHPAHIRIPPGRSTKTIRYVRDRVFDVFRRADELVPGWYCYVADVVATKKETGSAAANLMTSDLRELVGGSKLQFHSALVNRNYIANS